MEAKTPVFKLDSPRNYENRTKVFACSYGINIVAVWLKSVTPNKQD